MPLVSVTQDLAEQILCTTLGIGDDYAEYPVNNGRYRVIGYHSSPEVSRFKKTQLIQESNGSAWTRLTKMTLWIWLEQR